MRDGVAVGELDIPVYGIGATPILKASSQTAIEMAADACRPALADAGSSRRRSTGSCASMRRSRRCLTRRWWQFRDPRARPLRGGPTRRWAAEMTDASSRLWFDLELDMSRFRALSELSATVPIDGAAPILPSRPVTNNSGQVGVPAGPRSHVQRVDDQAGALLRAAFHPTIRREAVGHEHRVNNPRPRRQSVLRAAQAVDAQRLQREVSGSQLGRRFHVL